MVPDAEWVLAGEGVATRKWDGTPFLVREGRLYKRYDAKHGKTPPANWEPLQPAPDPESGHWPGWLPVGDGPEDAAIREAAQVGMPGIDGTYELCGPKVNRNPEDFPTHVLVPHGARRLDDAPRSFEELRAYFQAHDIEGIVWHHPDGRMVKIKGKDFGIRRPKPVPSGV